MITVLFYRNIPSIARYIWTQAEISPQNSRPPPAIGLFPQPSRVFQLVQKCRCEQRVIAVKARVGFHTDIPIEGADLLTGVASPKEGTVLEQPPFGR